MTESFSLGKNGELGKIDFSKLRSGITKEDLNIEEGSVLASIFDRINTNDEGESKGKLDRQELNVFISMIKNLAGKDTNLSTREAKNFELSEDEKLGRKNRKELLTFLSKLSGLTSGISSVKTQNNCEVITYGDGKEEKVFSDGSKIITVNEGKTVTTTEIDANGKTRKETKTTPEGTEETEYEEGSSNLKKQTIKKGDSVTVVTYSDGKKVSKIVKDASGTKEYSFDENGNAVLKKESNATETKTYDGDKVTTESKEDGVQTITVEVRGKTKSKKTTKTNGNNQTEVTNRVYEGDDYTEDVTVDNKPKSQTKVVNGQEYTVNYDENGNTLGVIVQNGESIQAIAKKFGVTPEALVKANASLLKGRRYFNVGAEIKIPRTMEADEYSKAQEGRLDKEGAVQQFNADAERREAERQAKIGDEIVRGGNNYYVTKTSNGELHYWNPDKQEITAEAFKAKCPTIYKDVTEKQRGATARTRNIYDTDTIRQQAGDLAKEIHGQISGASINENTINLLRGITPENAAFVVSEYQRIYGVSLAEDIDDEWGLDLNTVKEHIYEKLVDQAKSLGLQGTYSNYQKINDLALLQNWITQVSSTIINTMKNAKETYYATEAEETQIQQSKELQKTAKTEAEEIVNDLIKKTRGYNNVDKIKDIIRKIDKPEEIEEVNRLLTLKGYPPTDKYSAIEHYIYKEANNSVVHTYNSSDYLEQTVQKWINNGTLKGQAANEAQARMAARVLYDGGDGFGTDCEKIKKAVRMIKCPKPTGNREADNKQAREVYRLVNNMIKKHNTFYGLGSPSTNLLDYCRGEMWESEVKYLNGILAETNAIQGQEKAQAVSDLTQEAVEGAGTDIEYLEQAIRGIDSPEDRKAVEVKLKEYCLKKDIKPQIAEQAYLQAILYDECDTFMGISTDHKEIRKFNEMLISQGAYTKNEAVNLRAEQAALQILEGDFENAKDAVQQIKDPKVYAKVLQLVQTKYGGDLDNFLLSKMSQEKADLVQAELAGNGMIAGDSAVNVAFRLIQSSDFNIRAKGLMAIRNGEVAKKVDNMLKAHDSSLAKVMEQFNKEKAEYKSKAAFWDGLAMFGGGCIAEHISDRYRDNTDVSDNMYIEATNATALTQNQKDAYNQAVKTFEECLNKMKADYQEALDSQGVVSGAINAFCSVYNLGTTRDEIEARIEHDTETLRLLKLAAQGKLTKYVNGKESSVSFEDVWKERQSDRVTANAVTITNAVETVRGKKEVTFDAKKVEKVENKAQTLAAMDYAKDNIVVCWDELSNAKTEKQYAVAIMDTLEKLSNMSGKKMSLVYFGYSLKNGIIVDNAGKPVSTAKLQELANQLKKGLSDVSNSLFGTSLSQDSSSNKLSSVLEEAYDKKVESFKQDYRDAFGQECPDEMIESYMTTISRGMMVANVGVMIGAVIAAPFTGGGSLAEFALGAGASVAMNALEHSTDADGWTNTEWTTDLSQAAWDGILTATGYKVGQIAEAFAKGASTLSGQDKWISTMLNKMPKAQATKALSKAEEVAKKVETYAGKLGKDVLQSKKANLLVKYPTMKPETAEKVATIVARVEATGFEVSSDTLQSLVQMYCMEGEFNTESFATALYMSIGANAVGHAVSARSAMKEHVDAPKTHPTGDKPKYIVPENETAFEKATRNGNNSEEVAPPRTVQKLSDTEFQEVKVNLEDELKQITVADDSRLEILQKRIDALQNREQRRVLQSMLNEKKNALGNAINEPKVENDNSKAPADESKVKTDEEKVEEPKINEEPKKNATKSYSEMNENELFVTYNQLKNEVIYSPLSTADKAAKINELKKIEAELNNKGFRIEGDKLVSNKKKVDEAKSNDNVKSEFTTESVREKYGKKIARMYNAVINSIEKMKTKTDFDKISSYISKKFSKYTDVLVDLQNKLIQKVKSIGLQIKESINSFNTNGTNPNAKPASSNFDIKTQRLQKGQPFEVQGSAKLNLANEIEINLDDPEIKARIDNLPEGGRLTIGRKGDIKINGQLDRVSRRHVTIEKRNGKIYVIDNSANGTVITQRVKTERAKESNIDSQYRRTSDEFIPDELVRNAGNDGKPINENYIIASKDLRKHYNNAIANGTYANSYKNYVQTITRGHIVAYGGFDQKHTWYQKVGNGNIEISPGKIRGEGQMSSNREEMGRIVENIAKEYGDNYSTSDISSVKLEGIPKEAYPTNAYTRHIYPDGKYMRKYFEQMQRTAKEALELIENGASQDKILVKLAEHYQYAANARPFGQINNSLFMNEINTLLQKAGMKPIPHGILDHVAQRMQPDAFKKYFIDEYKKTALDAPTRAKQGGGMAS